MTLLAKSTLSAVAAAIAAAALLTTVAVPAQAGHKGAYQIKKQTKPAMKKLYVLKCLASKGDVVGQPLVINTSGKTLPIGRKIRWRVLRSNATAQNGTYTLTKPLYAGQSRRIPQPVPVSFSCWASVWA
jgi:hypothetical protein